MKVHYSFRDDLKIIIKYQNKFLVEYSLQKKYKIKNRKKKLLINQYKIEI